MKKITTRNLVVIAMLSAVSFILMMLDFSVPFMPSFIKMDISELPALIGAFAMGPVEGVLICLVKNLLNLLRSTTGGVGELCNFLLGASFVLTAGLIYHKNRTRKGAIIASLVGAAVMAAFSVPCNYYLTYPIYSKFMPMDAIIGAYQAINPKVNGLLQCLLVFNMPFTFCKGFIDVVVTFLVYKRLSPIIKGEHVSDKKMENETPENIAVEK